MASNSIRLSSLLFLVIFIHAKADLSQPKETKMTLYFQDYSGGPNATVIEITGQPNGLLSFAKFGAIFCTDDPITEEFDESSAQIARAQDYKGSTLEVQGSSAQFERVREVAVVGGTGKFRLARGYATFETIHYDHALHYAVIQCNVTVLHY
ncbi:hypothetical protein DH2020_025090 [Rehmannia glutinosa]|uniref:Dirigent protein n=1 Tax=Rehmannia glutinosa TaxID=99300 RepID=A0ABR0W1K0_REHGL